MRMVEPRLQLPESVAKADCHIGSDRKMSQEVSPVAEGTACPRYRKIEKVDLPQIAANSGNPQNRLEKEKPDLNVQCYLEKLEDMLKHQELMLVDLLRAMRKTNRKGTRVTQKRGQSLSSREGYMEDVGVQKSMLSGMSTDTAFTGELSQKKRAPKTRTIQSSLVPKFCRFHTHEFRTSRTHRDIWRFLEDRRSGPGAMFTSACLSLIVLSNTVLLFFDACLSLDGGALWLLIVCHFILAAEFLLRFHVAPSQTVFMCNVPNIFEMICLGVFSACFVNWAFAETQWHDVRIFLPALMMMRAVRRFKIFHLLSGAFKVALDVLPVLMYSLGIIIASFAALVAAVESRENETSYGEALWLVTVTVFTVGYGDYVPLSDYGRLACAVLMMISCLYMAIPIGIVGTAFQRIWLDKDRLMALQDLRDQISWSGLGVEDTLRIFEKCTEGGVAEISPQTFKGIIFGFRCEWRDDVIQSVFDLLDTDGCGSLDIDEFLFGLFPTQRFFWTHAVEGIKSGGLQKKTEEGEAGLCPNRPEEEKEEFPEPGDLEEKAEENEVGVRPKHDPDHDCFRFRREKYLINDQKELDPARVAL